MLTWQILRAIGKEPKIVDKVWELATQISPALLNPEETDYRKEQFVMGLLVTSVGLTAYIRGGFMQPEDVEDFLKVAADDCLKFLNNKWETSPHEAETA